MSGGKEDVFFLACRGLYAADFGILSGQPHLQLRQVEKLPFNCVAGSEDFLTEALPAMG